MKFNTILSCSLAALLVGAQASAWQDREPYTTGSQGRSLQSHRNVGRSQRSVQPYHKSKRAGNRAVIPAGQSPSDYGAGAQPTRNQLYVTVPPAAGRAPVAAAIPAETQFAQDQTAGPSYQYPPNPNPYHAEGRGRDVLTEALDWLLSIPAGVVSRFSDGGEPSVFPEMPATQGALPGQTTEIDNAPYEQPVAVPISPPPSPYELRERRR